MNKLKYLVIHATATPEGREVSAEDIRRWHTAPKPQGRGWRQVGYSDIIHLNGDIQRLVDYNEDQWVQNNEITNGARGFNSVSRHVVYVGGADENLKPKDTRTPQQHAALYSYVVQTIAKHPDIKVLGHKDFPDVSKACPSFDVKEWMQLMRLPKKNIYNG